MKEHYGLELAESSIRIVAQRHAHNIKEIQKSIQVYKPDNLLGKEITIAQTDGAMVPIVTIDDAFEGDKRTTRKTEWKEYRLALARKKGTITPVYSALIGSTEEAGDQLQWVVDAIGKNNGVHCVGDGAPWIAEQVERVFGNNAHYLIDLYHLSGYLASAASCCSTENEPAWLYAMQKLIKANNTDLVIQELENHFTQHTEDSCPAFKCYNYIIKRMNQLDYKSAIEQDLPIGSGEIEGGHRSVVQKRLKLAGGWWRLENAQAMLAMLTLRANGFWNNYWNRFRSYEFAIN